MTAKNLLASFLQNMYHRVSIDRWACKTNDIHLKIPRLVKSVTSRRMMINPSSHSSLCKHGHQHGRQHCNVSLEGNIIIISSVGVPVLTVWITTYIVKSHSFLCSVGLRLEEDGFFTPTQWARMIFCPG